MPVQNLSDLRRVIIIAPHPDDEIFGVGCCIIHLLESKAEVYVIYLTDGERSQSNLDPAIVGKARVRISDEVLASLGLPAKNVFRFHFPDGGLPFDGDPRFAFMADRLTEVLVCVKPDAVMVTHPLETWPYDHVAASELTLAAMGNANLKDIAVYGFWVWLPYSLPVKRFMKIDWKRTVRAPVGDKMRIKKILMKAYLSPLAPNGSPWSGILPDDMLTMFDYPYEIMSIIGKK